MLCWERTCRLLCGRLVQCFIPVLLCHADCSHRPFLSVQKYKMREQAITELGLAAGDPR